MLGVLQTGFISGVDDINYTPYVLEIVAPHIWDIADAVRAAYIPNGKRDALVLNSLHNEPNCRDCCYNLTKLELVKNCCFPSSIKPNLNWSDRGLKKNMVEKDTILNVFKSIIMETNHEDALFLLGAE